METNFTVRLAQFLSKLLILWLIPFTFFCRNQPLATTLRSYNADSVLLHVNNGIYYKDKAFFTGRLYALNEEKDTLYIKNYKNGIENGLSKSFYENGQIQEIRLYKAGKKTGVHQGWWPNGNRQFLYNFNEDMFEGEQHEWYSNGKHFRVMHYMDGHENGIQTAFDIDGSLTANYEARNGRNYGNIGRKNCKSIWTNDSISAAPLFGCFAVFFMRKERTKSCCSFL